MGDSFANCVRRQPGQIPCVTPRWARSTSGVFLGNAEDGVNIVNDGSAVQQVGLTNVIASDNGESGLDIEANEVTLRRVLSGLEQGNGLADVLP